MAGSARTFDPNAHNLHEVVRALKMLRLQVPLATYDQIIPPTLSGDSADDISKGWKVGSIWIDTASNPKNIYQCASNADGAPVWKKMADFQMVDSSGQVAGGSSPTNLHDNEIIRAHGIDGNLQGSVVTIDDAGVISGITGGLPTTDILAERATQAIAAGTTITVTDGSPVTPFTTTGNITNTAAPFIAAGRNGQLVILRNDNGTGTLTISDTNIGVGGSLLRLSANTVTMAAGSTMGLEYSTIQSAWVQVWYLALVAVTPTINSHTINIGAGAASSQNAEIASSGTHTPTFAWTYTGVPSAGTVNNGLGGSYPATILTPFTSLVGPAYNKPTVTVPTTVTFTPSITVNGVVLTTPTATVTYINRRYCGPSTQTTTLTSAQILGLDGAGGTSDLSNSRTGTFSSLTIGASDYLWYAYRAALGTGGLFLSIGGEVAGFTEKQTALSHTNDSSFVENFATWRSENQNLGAGISAVVATTEPNNRIYIGPGPITDPITNANILALDDTADGESIVSSTLARTYTAIKIEAAEYLWFVHPDRIADLATIKDAVTGFGIDGAYMTNVSHTNQYGYVETYRCWRSTNANIFPAANDVIVT